MADLDLDHEYTWLQNIFALVQGHVLAIFSPVDQLAKFPDGPSCLPWRFSFEILQSADVAVVAANKLKFLNQHQGSSPHQPLQPASCYSVGHAALVC